MSKILEILLNLSVVSLCLQLHKTYGNLTKPMVLVVKYDLKILSIVIN